MHQVQRRGLLPARRWGPADRVTLVRAVLAAVVAVLAVVSLVRHVDPWPLVALATVGLVLDGVDGRVARRTGTVSAFGARFDMETDAFLLLALSVHVAPTLGAWVLLVGAARYLFWVAQVLAPRLRDPAPPRPWCKVVAVVQGVALVVATAPLLPRWLDVLVVAGALVLLVESFAHEAWDRWQHRTSAPAPFPLGTVLAVLLLWACLLVPDRPAEVAWGHWARLPLEALLLGLVLTALPRRPARAVAVAAGLVVGLLAVHALLDLGFRAALDRPVDVLHDRAYAGGAVDLVEDALGRWPGRVVVALLVVAALLLVAALPLALRRLVDALHAHRRVTLPLVSVLAVAGTLASLTGAVVARETASHAADTVARVRHDLAAERAFERALADASGAPPAFARLRGRNVLVVFVESYGRTALEDAEPGGPVDRALDRGGRRLARAGWRSRSGWLTSPTYGGLSWLAHATLHSGLWVDSERRYDALLDSRRPTLARMLGEAGWRTVDVVPSNRRPWPEGERFYGWDRVYAGEDLGYAGPRLGFAAMPDQFTLDALQRLELGGSPVLAEVDLVSSHVPWTPLPRMVPWSELGDGSVFDAFADRGPSTAQLWAQPGRARAAYEQSVSYSLDAVTSFLARLPTRGPAPVVLVLGDHQPAHVVPRPGGWSGPSPSHDVPVTLLSRDRDVMRYVARWRWRPGLRPGADSPVWRMDTVRDRFVAAFR